MALGGSGPDGVPLLAVAGVGFGLMSGAFSMINLLADSLGPGTVGIHGDSQLYFLTSGERPAPFTHVSAPPQRWQTHRGWNLPSMLFPPCCTLYPSEPLQSPVTSLCAKPFPLSPVTLPAPLPHPLPHSGSAPAPRSLAQQCPYSPFPAPLHPSPSLQARSGRVVPC